MYFLGQICLNLFEIVKSEGNLIKFEENISFFGRIFGKITGEIEYELFEVEDQNK